MKKALAKVRYTIYNIKRSETWILSTGICLICLLLNSSAIYAQQKKVSKFEEPAKQQLIEKEFANESAVILDLDINIEYKEDKNNVWIYRTIHRTVKVLNESGIESFNKMSLVANNGGSIEDMRARTITREGKVFDISPEMVKLSKDEGGRIEYLFAMEGVSKEAEIEIQYTEKKPFALFGSELFQFHVPVQHTSFSLSVPARLHFEVKGYCAFPQTKDTLVEGRRYYSAEKSNIKPIHEEQYANTHKLRMHADYKLSYLPLENPAVRVYTWKDLAKYVYKRYYDFSDKEKKAVERFLKASGINEKDDELSKILKIEEGIKKNIVLNKELRTDDNSETADVSIENKVTSETGYLRLFTACFTLAHVKNELGVCTDRFENYFDEDFENWNNLETYLFYFPNQKQFIDPHGIFYRYPVISASALSNKGVFCKTLSVGELTSATADIREITPLKSNESQNNIDIVISFAADKMEPQADMTFSFSGYTAPSIRAAVLTVPKDKEKEMILNIVGLKDKPDDISVYTIENAGLQNFSSGTPLKINVKLTIPGLLEHAGPKYLFKAGELIGKQQELYQASTRELPVDIPYPHEQNRTITINIPDGYKISNPEASRLHAEFKDAEGNITMEFNSDYIQGAKTLTINVTEFYASTSCEVKEFENFRRVINASADFNKVVLLLVKK